MEKCVQCDFHINTKMKRKRFIGSGNNKSGPYCYNCLHGKLSLDNKKYIKISNDNKNILPSVNFSLRHILGVERFYPNCKIGALFCNLVNNASIGRTHVQILKKIGFDIIYTIPTDKKGKKVIIKNH